ncbi:hypothetical protein Tco_0196332 [Tanacetum coccineum]
MFRSPPTRTDEQIVPRSQWLIIGKATFFQCSKRFQRTPLSDISRHLSNTQTSSEHSLPQQIFCYLSQQFEHYKYDEENWVLYCQVMNNGCDLSADLLRKAYSNYSVSQLTRFELPSVPTPRSANAVERPRQTNVDHAELLWEEFTQGIQTFFSHKASHKASLKDPKKKVTPLLIPYGRFSKVIIYYLASNNNIHRRPDSAVHHTRDDFILGNLKFVPKGETVEVFGMAIPDPLITEAIQQSSYYPKYLEMVAKNTKKTPQESASEQPATKRAPPKKPTTTTPVKPSKPAPAPTKKPSKHKLPQKVRKGKPTFQLVDEDDEAQQESVPQEEGRAPVGGVTIRDPVSETTPKLPEVVGKEAAAPKGDKEQGEVDSSTVTSGVSIPVSTQGQAGSDPEKAHEAPCPGLDPEPMQ